MFALMQVSAKGLVNLSIDQTGVTEKFTNLKLDEKKGPKASFEYRSRRSGLYCVLPGLGSASIAMTLVFLLLKASKSFSSV